MGREDNTTMNLKKALKKSVKAAKDGDLKEKDSRIAGFPKEVKLARDGTFIFPDAPGVRADLLYILREERLKLQRQCETFEKAESALRDYFIETLPSSEASGLAGSTARVQIETKAVPQVSDWEKFYTHVKRTGNFELLQRRLNEGAIKERWEDKKEVPGVTVFFAKKVSCTKI